MLSLDEMYAAVGFGTITTAQVTAKLQDIYNKHYKKTTKLLKKLLNLRGDTITKELKSRVLTV